MGDATRSVERVHLLREKVLVVMLSSSSTCYWVDNRGEQPLLFRARGQGRTGRGPGDDQWVPLWGVLSEPRLVDLAGRALPPGEVDESDLVPDVLRVGSRHRLTFLVPGYLGPEECWWLGRMAEELIVHESFPPPGQRTRPATEVDFADGPMHRDDGGAAR
ncbi:hypothetical protein [Demequina maris]|uniref:hypothetical protein n=1 Tax=Demequina maris TaxID=1638982 RepID=UPI0007843A9F|nr:hypothetical protein [Demequina maris]